jgi:hypothetical protein
MSLYLTQMMPILEFRNWNWYSMILVGGRETLSCTEPDLFKKIQKFSQKLLLDIEEQKKLDLLERQGKTWNIIHLDGTILQRGVRGLNLATGTEDQRLFIHE